MFLKRPYLGRAASYRSRGLSSPDERPSSSIESAKKHTEKGGARFRLTGALDSFSRDSPGHTGGASHVRREPLRQPNFGNKVQFSDFVGVCNDPRSSSGFRQRANAVLIATRRRLSRVSQCAHHWPLTTTTNDGRYKTGANRARIWALGTCRPSGGRIPAPWRGARPVAEGSSGDGGALLRPAARC